MDNAALRTLLRTRSNRLRDSRIEDRLTPPNRRLVSASNEPLDARARPTYPLTSLFPRYFALYFLSAFCIFPNENQTRTSGIEPFNRAVYGSRELERLLYKLVKAARGREPFPWVRSVIRCTSTSLVSAFTWLRFPLIDGNERAACNNRVTRSPADHFHLRTLSTSIFPTEASPIPIPRRSFPLSGRISSELATDTTFRRIESKSEDTRSDYSPEEELRSDNCAYMENRYHVRSFVR